MRFLALACDYDGTLADEGRLAAPTRAALAAVRASGRKLLVVTGRERPDLERVAAGLDLFDLVVAENGAVLYWPGTGAERLLAPAPPPAFVAALRRAGVTPLGVGRCIVATVHPHEHTVREIIRQLGLELAVVFNKGAVMVLPAGVDKATGLAAALAELGLSPAGV
ncbi:MAG TPA: HAD hydrolase family protein, partial [Polyangia bacterium]